MVCAPDVHRFSHNWDFCCGDEVMSKRDLKILFFALTAPFVTLGVFAVIIACYVICTYDDSITIKPEVEILSPDGTRKAVVFTAAWGGGAGGKSHSVAVLNSSDPLDESVYRSDRTVIAVRCCDSIDVNWLNDSMLHVGYIKEDEYAVYRVVEKWDGISIDYDEIETSAAAPTLHAP